MKTFFLVLCVCALFACNNEGNNAANSDTVINNDNTINRDTGLYNTDTTMMRDTMPR